RATEPPSRRPARCLLTGHSAPRLSRSSTPERVPHPMTGRMILIPSLTLRGGRVVASGAAGDVLAEDPIAAARRLRDEGALFFHLEDAERSGDHREVVARFVDAGLPCQLAGGIVDPESLEAALRTGADRVVVDLDAA